MNVTKEEAYVTASAEAVAKVFNLINSYKELSMMERTFSSSTSAALGYLVHRSNDLNMLLEDIKKPGGLPYVTICFTPGNKIYLRCKTVPNITFDNMTLALAYILAVWW